MRVVQGCGVAAFVVAVVAVSSASSGADYTFTDVVNSTGAFDSLYHPVINNRGTIGFLAVEDQQPGETWGKSGAYMLKDGVLSRLSDAGVSINFGLSMNERDEVAFVERRAASSSPNGYEYAIRRGSDASNVSTIATASAVGSSVGQISEPLWLSETGDVFYVRTEQRGRVVLKGPDPVADYVMHAAGGDVSKPWFLDGFLPDGTPITRSNGPDGWTFYKGANREEVALHAGRDYTFALSYGENVKGQKVFWGRPAVWLRFAIGYDAMGIYSGPDRANDTIVERIGWYPWIGRPVLNDLGMVVFPAELDKRGNALYTGPDPLKDRIVGKGDSLFGSVVEEVAVDYPFTANDDFLNDLGQVVFAYRLANGVSGIGLATPVPEPGVAVAGVAIATGMLSRRRRRCA